MDCKQAQPLVPSYSDGELSELQAGQLRKHLMDCQPCRALAQEQKSFQRWFVPSEPVAVPQDFAARVARRAFAGDTGLSVSPALPGVSSDGRSSRREAPILQFAMRMALAAALILMMVSIGIGIINQPDRNAPAHAELDPPQIHQILEELDALKAKEAALELEQKAAEADAK